MSFTKGPWEMQPRTEKGRGRGSYTIIGSNLGGLVGAACPWPTELDTNDFSRVLANARLIAAAPELYEVLKITTRKLEAAYRSLGMPISENPHLKIAHEVLAKAEGNDQLEGFRDFMRRRFCSLSCANSRPKGGSSRKAAHYHARKQRNLICEACGAEKRLQVHHVNEDWTDNRPDNLQTLCIFCHMFWHATHKRLGATPTRRMPQLGFPSVGENPSEWDACGVMGMASLPKRRKPSLKHISKSKDET